MEQIFSYFHIPYENLILAISYMGYTIYNVQYAQCKYVIILSNSHMDKRDVNVKLFSIESMNP